MAMGLSFTIHKWITITGNFIGLGVLAIGLFVPIHPLCLMVPLAALLRSTTYIWRKY